MSIKAKLTVTYRVIIYQGLLSTNQLCIVQIKAAILSVGVFNDEWNFSMKQLLVDYIQPPSVNASYAQYYCGHNLRAL